MHNPSILIVEDEVIIAAHLAILLERLGYRVAGSVTRGEEAVALAQTEQLSLVVMDIRLAGSMDGIDTAIAIRRTTGLPVVFLTAHWDNTTLERAGAADPCGYILKPFEERDLRVQLEMALRKHAAELLREREKHQQVALIEQHGARLEAALKREVATVPTELVEIRKQTTALLRSYAPSASACIEITKLTARQLQVLHLVAEGHAGKSIAALLNISPKTVEYHKATLMQQLGMRSTAELTRYAIKHGLVAPG